MEDGRWADELLDGAIPVFLIPFYGLGLFNQRSGKGIGIELVNITVEDGSQSTASLDTIFWRT